MQTIAFFSCRPLSTLIGHVPLLYYVFEEFWHDCSKLVGVVQNGPVLFFIALKIHADRAVAKDERVCEMNTK